MPLRFSHEILELVAPSAEAIPTTDRLARDHARSIPQHDNLLPIGGSDGSARRHQDIRARRRKWELFGGCARAWDRAAGNQQAGRSARRTSRCAASYAHLSQSEPDRGWTRLLRICRATHQRSRSSGIPRRFGTGLAVWRGARHRRARLLSPLCRAETTFVPRALSQRRRRDAGLRADEQFVEEGIDLAIRNGALADS